MIKTSKKNKQKKAPKEKRVLSDKEKEKRKKKRKLQIKGVIALAVIGFGAYAYDWLFSPRQGGMAFGVCKVFIEGHVRYPNTLQLNSVEYLEGGASIRIWYTQIDSFGEYRLEAAQCFFRAPKEEDVAKYGVTPFVLQKISIDRQDIEPKEIERINKTITTIMAYPPSLDLPYPLSDTLKNLQLERRARF